eukprot:TRINITY_DN3115_c2_g11_i1.p1 TRINITY_DN3115_c2_g11~~TRINITY_DN3115_c2_g11_i1.p1  ORF type:complete len:348 (+),score=78.79 TRINITY_DN3115_c2_g11_i1:716-1759(+)
MNSKNDDEYIPLLELPSDNEIDSRPTTPLSEIQYEADIADRRLLSSDGKFQGIIKGMGTNPLTDLYHSLLTSSWPKLLLYCVIFFLTAHTIFACFFYMSGPDAIANADEDSPLKNHPFWTCFFFSIHTFSTIGYGVLYPRSWFANVFVGFEVLSSYLTTAIITGLMFAKFSRPTAKVIFSEVAVIHDRDSMNENLKVLKFRCANGRHNNIVEANIRVSLVANVFDETVKSMIRKSYSLVLDRDQTLLFGLTWTVSHLIDESSPIYGWDRNKFIDSDAEIVVSFTGVDGTMLETIYARYGYDSSKLLFDRSFVNILSVLPDGRNMLNYEKFHETQKFQNIPSVDEDFV